MESSSNLSSTISRSSPSTNPSAPTSNPYYQGSSSTVTNTAFSVPTTGGLSIPVPNSATLNRRARAASLEKAANALPPLPYNPAFPTSSVDAPIQELLRVTDIARKKVETVTDTVRDGVNRVANHAAAKLDPLKKVALGTLDPLKTLTEHEIKRAEQLLRSRLGGLDDSLSSATARKRQLEQYKQVFDMIDIRKKGAVPINDVEDLFGIAELYEARTEVGQLSYDADTDGNGSLDFQEFCVVLDKIGEYHKHTDKVDTRGSFFFGTEGASLTMKQIIWRTLDDPVFSHFSRIIGFFLLSAVAVAVSVFVLQTMPGWDEQYHYLFNSLEFWSLSVFTGEYTVRFLTAPDRKKFLYSISNFIDLLTIIPFYVEAIYDTYAPSAGGNTLRVIRIFRIFRIFKVFKYVPYVSIMTQSAAASAAPICMAVFVMIIGMILLAFAAYFTERGIWDPEKNLYVQANGVPSTFQSIADASYWAIVTLTTVGYGDLVPATNPGKLVGALTALAGTVIVAFPVSIYTEEFGKEYNHMVKTKALQAELAGADLCTRLLATKERLLETVAVEHFPPGNTLTSTLSPVAPRNLMMMRRARQLRVEKAAGLTNPVFMNKNGQEYVNGTGLIATVRSMITGSSGDSNDKTKRTIVDKSSNQPIVFYDIWRNKMAKYFNVQDDETVTWAAHESSTPYTAVTNATEPLLSSTAEVSETKDKPIEEQVQQAWFTRLSAKLHAAVPKDLSASIHHQASSRSSRGRRAQSTSGSGGNGHEIGITVSSASGTNIDSSLSGGRAVSAPPLKAEIIGKAAKYLNLYRSNPDGVLSAKSFVSYDLTEDKQVERAILALLSDKRKQLWAQTRILESRFRDDLSIELARRWQFWMSMPREYVRDVTEPFVFRKRDLRRGLGFRRNDLNLGIIANTDHEYFQNTNTSSASSAYATPGAKNCPGSTKYDTETAYASAQETNEYLSTTTGGGSEGKINIDGYSSTANISSRNNKGNHISASFRDLINTSLPITNLSSAQAVLEGAGNKAKEVSLQAANLMKHGVEKGVTKMRDGVDNLKERFEGAISLAPINEIDPNDYQARIRAQYEEVLGADGKKFNHPRRTGTSTSSSARQRLNSNDNSNATTTVTAKNSDTALEDSNFTTTTMVPVLDADLNAENLEYFTKTNNDSDANISIAHHSQELIQTAFGVSSLLRNMPTITSSVTTGTASIAASKAFVEPAINGYWQYFSRISSAPLRTEEGEEVTFDVSTPGTNSGTSNNNGSNDTGSGMRNVLSSTNLQQLQGNSGGGGLRSVLSSSNLQRTATELNRSSTGTGLTK